MTEIVRPPLAVLEGPTRPFMGPKPRYRFTGYSIDMDTLFHALNSVELSGSVLRWLRENQQPPLCYTYDNLWYEFNVKLPYTYWELTSKGAIVKEHRKTHLEVVMLYRAYRRSRGFN